MKIIFSLLLLIPAVFYALMSHYDTEIQVNEKLIEQYKEQTERTNIKIANKKSREKFERLKAERMELERKLQKEEDSKVYSTLVTNTKVPYLSFYLDRSYFVYNIKFKQSFIDKYEYEKSDSFCFAVNIQSDSVGWYHNTYRNHNGGVSNSSRDLCPWWDIICRLDWCIPAIAFMGSGIARSFEWYAVNNYFANKYSYWYKQLILREWNFKLYMSSVKELPRTEVFEITLSK